MTTTIPHGYELIRADEGHAEELARNNVACALAGGLELDYETALRGVRRTLRLPDCAYFILREAGTRQVVAQYKQVWAWNDFFARPMVWMEHLFVTPGARDKDFGKLLVAHFIASAGETRGDQPPAFPILLVHKENTKAKALYDSCGFIDLEYYWMIHKESWRPS